MQKKHLLTFCCWLSLCLGAYAQPDPKAKAESDRLMKLYQQLQGTYQVQVIDSREKVGFPLTLLDSIMVKRQQDKTVYLWIKNNIRVSIPPYSEINKKDFVRLEQTAYYSSQNLPHNP